MIYENLKNDYFGIKVTFDNAPIINFPELKSFIFSGHELLTMLAQSLPMLHELWNPKLAYRPDFPYPVKAASPPEWLDMSQLPEQSKGNAQKNPKLILDVGGRKMSINIPSDKYVYDKGELPLYAACYGLPAIDFKEELSSIIFSKEEDKQILEDPLAVGINPVLSLGNPPKERLSYADFYQLILKHYGTALNSAKLVQICRRVLAGERLPSADAPVIPIMLTTLFGAEVSRNRACLITGIFLLDLMQARITAPSIDGSFDFYRFENVLWHPDFYPLTGPERRSDLGKAQSKLGGFHPMTHIGSWSEEFQAMGPYQSNADLTWSHVKSVTILIDWLSHLPPDQLSGIQITKLNVQDYRAEKDKEDGLLSMLRAQGKRLHGTSQVLHSYLTPFIKKRLASFESMLSEPESINLSDQEYFSLQTGMPVLATQPGLDLDIAGCGNRDQEVKNTQEYMNAELANLLQKHLKKSKEYQKQKQEKTIENTAFHQQTDFALRESINLACQDLESSVSFLTNRYPHFSRDDFHYCNLNKSVSPQQIVFLISKLHETKEPITLSLLNMLLNITDDERLIIYRAVITNSYLCQHYSERYDNLSGFVKGLSYLYPLSRFLINVLLEERCGFFLGRMTGEELFEICSQSNDFFKIILLNKPQLFLKIVKDKVPHEISGLLYQVKERDQWRLTIPEINLVLEHNYNENVNSIFGSFLHSAPSGDDEFDCEKNSLESSQSSAAEGLVSSVGAGAKYVEGPSLFGSDSRKSSSSSSSSTSSSNFSFDSNQSR